MSDAVDYLHAYAVRAICKARRMPSAGRSVSKGPLDESIFYSRRRRLLPRMSTISTTSGPSAKLRNRSYHLRFEGHIRGDDIHYLSTS